MADVVFQTFQAIGNREDLIDVITNISPMDTFITSSTGSTVAKGVYHEWQTDSLAAAGANAQVEGADVDTTALTATERAGNYCQILSKNWKVSATQEAVSKAGRTSELSYQQGKKLKELAKDIEYALLVNSSAVSGASGTARELCGILGWLTTNVTSGTASGEALREVDLNDALQGIWAQGGEPATVLVGTYQKRKIDAFTTNTRQVVAGDKKLVAAVDVYESSFGPVFIRLHRQLNTTQPATILILGDMGLWKKAWLRPVVVQDLAKTSTATKQMVEAELTLESLQEKGAGKIITRLY